MLTFLFWNIQKKPLLHRVARIANTHAADVVILAECAHTDADLLAELNAGGQSKYKCPDRTSDRFRVASTSPKRRIPSVYDDTSLRLSIHDVHVPNQPSLTLALVHLPGKNRPQSAVVQRVATELRDFEEQQGHRRTILVGDFNLSPFDDPMVNALGFHSLMTRELAGRRNRRIVQGESYPAFFNPMWQFLTDRGPRPAGTFYFHDSGESNHFWYTLDQVMVRPELADKLVDVALVETDGVESLLDPNHSWPDTSGGSDHLPLLFRLDWWGEHACRRPRPVAGNLETRDDQPDRGSPHPSRSFEGTDGGIVGGGRRD